MKVFPVNVVESVAATSEQTVYPAVNTLDEHPKKPWKAQVGVVSATLDLFSKGMTEGLALFNIVADSVKIEVRSPYDTGWEAGTLWEPLGEEVPADTEFLEDGADLLIDGTDFLTDGEVSTSTPGTLWDISVYSDFTTIFGAEDFSEFQSLWIEFGVSFPVSSEVSITFTVIDPVAKTISVGVVVMGEILSFLNPLYGLMEGIHDYSKVKLLNEGATHVIDRDRVRTFSGSVQVPRECDFYNIMNVSRRNGMKPLAWRITDLPGHRWVVYARNENMPTGQHTFYNQSTINFNLIEVL